MKYVPTYQTATIAAQQQAPKLYTAVEHVATAIPAAGVAGYEPLETGSKYSSCLDTCNSADPRWRKYTISKYKYCCSRSSQYDLTQFDVPSAEKVGDASSKYADDAYYSYLYRKSRARRSRKSRPSRHSYRVYSQTVTSVAPDDESSGVAGETVMPSRNYHESPYMKYYRSRQQTAHQANTDASADPSSDGAQTSGTKYNPVKETRAYRRGRARDFDGPDAQGAPVHETNEEPEAAVGYKGGRQTGYGGGDYSVDSGSRYAASDARVPDSEDFVGGSNIDDSPDTDSSGKLATLDGASDYPTDTSSDVMSGAAPDDGESDNYKYQSSSSSSSSSASNARRRRKGGKSRRNKDSKYYKKSSRKNRYSKEHPSSQVNGTDYESSQASADQSSSSYHPESQSANGSGGAGSEEEQQSSYQKDSSTSSSTSSSSPNGNDDSEQQQVPSLSGNKFKQSLNDSTVANLSKTTMHLKEILSLLEKKAQLRGANDTSLSSQQASPSVLPVISTTVAPVTTTNIYSPSSSLFGGSQYSLPLSSSYSSDYLSTDLGLKSPYRFESQSPLSSSLGSHTLGYPPSYGALTSDTYGSALSPSFGPSHYGLGQMKHVHLPHGAHHRKRRVNRNPKYYSMMLSQKQQGSLSPAASLLHAAGKSALLNNPYYSALQYPYWYTRGSSTSVTNSYPYKNIHKNPYSPFLNGPVSSKLAAAASGSLYTDESRYNPISSSYDPLTNMASLRPTSTMRMRSKPFIYQPQVLPIYTRHSILTQPEVKK